MHARIIVILVTLKGNFLYFQVFSKILGLSTVTLSFSFRDPTCWQSTLAEPNAKIEKILKKAKWRVLFSDEAYTLSSTSGRDYGKEAIATMMGKMNSTIDGKS